ncbi:GTPase HflX [Pseudoglutamicibacter cumminsii]|uniref:GTPase HflX n=1 Tax=Pseudoglutamicibacter cumminsii TaxID=156979 RepID=UPI0019592227|nr:GTPase HflX [Pseudoglutamicibacter cumminsii]MBM7796498.1 GTP-binding protein HflX [Pseudoglutamicibacter cumminsii]
MTDHGSNTPDTPSEKSSTEHDREIQATIERILAADRERERLAGRGGSSADTTGSADSVAAEGVEVGAEGSDAADAVDPDAQASGRGQRGSFLRFGQAEALDVGQTEHSRFDGLQQDLEERRATRRVQGLSTELEDISEVEYRQLRLERVVLAGLWSDGTAEQAENSLRELAALAETAGSEVLDGVIQRRVKPDPGTYFGSGKATELRDIVNEVGADTVIVDSELAPSQRRGLEDVIKVKVIDRTALILDIFAQHAKSREGKAQVELAQLEYLLPRLRGWGESMSRQAGGQVAGGAGIGSRGPGETKIELDRRRIRNRMAKLRREIKGMKPAREAKRANRKRHSVPSVAIVGYTNAGKSSLLNRLTDAGVLVENALFATLDPTVRSTETPDGIGYTLTDTVGFVRNLPTHLVEAFRSTLEEAADADVLLHVVDASHPDPMSQIQAVHEVLADVEADGPEIIVLNKADLADTHTLAQLRRNYPEHVVVSARTGQGIEELKEAISRAIPRPHTEVRALIPYTEGDLVARLHGHDAELLELEHVEDGTRIHALVRPDLADLLAPYAEADGAEDGTDKGAEAGADA